MTSTSDIHVDGTAEDPAVRAQVRLAERNDRLLTETSSKAALLTELHLEPRDRQVAETELMAFCSAVLLPHLDAVDQALYAPGAGAPSTRHLVRALRIQHGIISGIADALGNAGDADAARAAARSLVTMLAALLEIQRVVLIPALLDVPGADLAVFVDDLDAVLSGQSLEKPAELDVREIPHGKRHPRIFGSYARLAPGESFVLVNNHDPKPLRREFEATYPGQFAWDYVESGPSRWRVRIGRLG